jgi:hypothetical protein
MKTYVTAPALFILAALFFYELKPFQTADGPHGGIVQRAENYNIELKSFNSNLYTYLLDQKLKPVGNKGISCTIRFFIPDSATMDATLKPYQENGFLLESNTIVYQSCKVIFKMPGKSVSARFENENIMVNKK